MRLNSDCVRHILLYLEEQNFNKSSSSEEIYDAIKGNEYSEDDVVYALKKMIEAQLITGKMFKGDGMIMGAYITDITYDGHKYLEDIRNPKAWKYAKDKASEIGSFSLKTLGMLAQQYISKAIKGEI